MHSPASMKNLMGRTYKRPFFYNPSFAWYSVVILVLLLSACQRTGQTPFSKALDQLSPTTQNPSVVSSPAQEIAARPLPTRNNSLPFENLPLDTGLSQSVVIAMLQDRQGFIWIATQDGLNRFDGYNFKVFKSDPEDPNSLGENFILDLWEDPQGGIWIATANGLNFYNPITGRFVRFNHDPDNPDSLGFDYIMHLAGDRNGQLWIGTAGGGVDSLNLEDASLAIERAADSDSSRPVPVRFTHLRHVDGDPNSLVSDTICDLHVDNQGALWIATEGGLHRRDPDSGLLKLYVNDPEDPGSLSDSHVTAIAQDSQGRMWFGTYTNGLNLLDDWQGGHFTRFLNDPGDPLSIGYNHIEALLFDSRENLWVGTEGGGLDRMVNSEEGSSQQNYFVHYKHDPLDLQSLANDKVWSILEDRSGIIWFGTFGSGLVKFDPSRSRFVHYRNVPGDPGSLSSNFIWSFFEDQQGQVWIGTASGGLDRWDRQADVFTHYRHNPEDSNSLSHDQVWTVMEDRKGTLWIGTAAGLDRFDRLTGTFKHFPMKSVFTILEDTNDNLWLGTLEGGLGRFDRETEQVIWYIHTPDDPAGLSDNSVIHLYQDHAGNIWIGTIIGGLELFDPASGRFTHFRYDPDNPAGLSSNTVLVVYQDRAERIWVGTSGGLELLDPKTGDFQHFREKDGLPNNVIYGILEDEQGYLWLSTNHGIARFDPLNKTFKNFDQRDGLQSNEFNQNAFLETRDGAMLFGGVNGFSYFYPQDITETTYIPAVVFTDFELFNTPVQPGKDSSLAQTIETTRVIHLPYSQNYLGFEFAALDYAAPQELQYAYIMEGLDRDWNMSGNRHFASYTKVPPGNYVLRVKSTNRDGSWGEATTGVNIVITPPFWRTWWFGLIVAGLVIGGIAGVVTLRIQSIEAQRRRLEQQVEQRTHELSHALEELKRSKEAAEAANRAKSAFLANISHELRTPLNAILGFSQLMIRQEQTGDGHTLTPEQRHNLQIINSSGEHLLGLINDVLEMSKIEAGRVELKIQIVNLHHLLDGLEEMFRLRAEAKDLWLTIERDPGLLMYVRTDEGKLRQILMNLLGNAVKFTLSGGVNIQVHTTTLPANNGGAANDLEPTHLLNIVIQDTGSGIAEDELNLIFQPFVQTASGMHAQEGTGLGLSISRQYARLMGGDISVTSQFGHGSTFALEVPVQRVESIDEPISVIRQVVGLEPGQPAYRLLVVDDKEVNRQLLISMLQPLGFAIQEAENGQEALEIWRQWQPHLIWMDMRMPVMDGFEATRRIKADPQGRTTLIIALTASALDEDRAVILAEGCDDYIRKPFRQEDLLNALAYHLGVKYLYAPCPEAVPITSGLEERMEGSSQGEMVVSLSKLPPELLAELHRLLLLGYWEAVQESLDQIKPMDLALYTALAYLASRYDQDGLLSLIDQSRAVQSTPDR